MAASKPAAKKKASTAKVSTTKKTTHQVRKSPAKKASAASKHATYRTLKPARAAQPFLSFKFTRQTLYWTILVVFVLVIQLWILNVQYNVMQAIDNLNNQTQESVVTPLPKAK